MTEHYLPPVPEVARRKAIRAVIDSYDSPERRRVRNRVWRYVRMILRESYREEFDELWKAQPVVDPFGNPVGSKTRYHRALSELAYMHDEEANELRLELWREIRGET